jgi:peptidoglycan/LPS O-acetylase OafA/YrhL
MIISTIMGVIFLPNLQYIFLKFFTGMTFTSCFHYLTLFPSQLDSPLWSISFEVFCYILLPVFMAVLFFFTGKKRSFAKAILFWAGAQILVLCANGLVHVLFTPDGLYRSWHYGMTGGSKWWMPNYNPVGFFAHFIMGVLASGFTVRLAAPSEMKEKLREKGLFDIGAMLFLLAIVLFLWTVRNEKEFSVGFQGQPFYFPYLTALIAGLLVTLAHSKFMGGWLDNPFFRFTAKISFGLYIWHFIVINLLLFYYQNFYYESGMREWVPWAYTSMIMIACSYVIATLSYYLLEKPFMDRAHKDLKKEELTGFPRIVYKVKARIRTGQVISRLSSASWPLSSRTPSYGFSTPLSGRRLKCSTIRP